MVIDFCLPSLMIAPILPSAEYPQNIIEDLSKTYDIVTIDGVSIAKELGNSKVLNCVVLGLAAKYIGFSEKEWLSVLTETVPQKTIDINVSAFKAGYNN